MQKDKLEQFAKILAVLKEDTVSSQQLTAVLSPILTAIQKAVDDMKKTAQQNESIVYSHQAEVQALRALLDQSTSTLRQQTATTLQKANDALDMIKSIDVSDGQEGAPGEMGPQGPAGQDGSPDTGEQIVEKINALSDDAPKIDASHITNLPKAVNTLVRQGGFRNLQIFDESTLITKAVQFMKFAGSGVQATVSLDGVVTVTIPGGSGTAADELASDSGDHTTFTISHTPIASTLLVINENTGQAVPSSAYTNTTTSITFTSSQQIDDGTGTLVTPTFRARYFF